MSLGIIPVYIETDLFFEAQLKHAGATVKQYIYEESISSCIHLLVLSWSFSDDPV